MNRAKSTLLIAFIALAATLSAQTYRLQIGYNNPKRFGDGVSSTYFNGIKLGGTAEFKLKNDFSLLTGVLYNIVYSDKIQRYPANDSARYETWGHSVDIPVHLTYTYPVFKNVKVFGFAGPNISVGLFQTQSVTSSLTDALNKFNGVTPGKVDFYSSSLINRLNLQIGVGGGIQWKKFLIKSGYDFGLNNLNRTNTAPLHQSGWYVSMAYEF